MNASVFYSHHSESAAVVPTSPENLFAFVDDHRRLSSHMSQSSWKMGGGKMEMDVDDGGGKRLGSKMRLAGRVFGIRLWVEETIVDREPPFSKAWETTGQPRLLVIGDYRMGFNITPQGNGALLRVFIEYTLPFSVPAYWLGRLLGKYYARWCTRQMVDDAVKHFTMMPSTP
jgi:hypothetical protein